MTDFLALIHSSSFYEFAALFSLAAFAGFLATILRQPLIIAFIAVGLLVGPSVLGIVEGTDEIALLAKLGIAILLFIVGLKLDLNLIRKLGAVALSIGLGQILATFIAGYLISLALGIDAATSVYVAVALTFSSTIIIVKLLSDKKEINSLHGRIALGVLIIQDLAVVISMIVLATLGNAASAGGASFTTLLSAIGEVTVYAILLIIFIGLFMRVAALHVVSFMAKMPELLLCFAIAWAVLLAAVCDVFGLSKELGGLLAGISLASTPFREAIISRLSSLRDFLLLFFFIALGTQIDLGLLGGQIVPAIGLSIFVLLFKPLIIMVLSGVMGYRKRTGFLAGLSLAQISEFSLIFITMAYGLNMVTQETLGLITMVALITIAISTYLISLSHILYAVADHYLDIFERKSFDREDSETSTEPSERTYDVILFGLGRYGQAMAAYFKQNNKKLLAIDFNPEEVKRWRQKGYEAIYGDACDPDFFHALPLKQTKWVVSALPQHDFGITHEDPRLIILQALAANKFPGKSAIACHRVESVERFKQAGADLVFLPYHDAAERAVNMVLETKK